MNLARNKFALLMCCCAALFGCDAPNAANDNAQNASAQKTVAIAAIAEHPSLDDIRLGVVEGLASWGYKEGENLTINFQSAHGNMATAGQIAKQFAADKPDAIVAISTPTSQSMVAATSSIPIIYTAVSDPVAAKLVDANHQATQANVTGLSSQLPLEPQIETFTKIVPNARRVGFVYSPGEANAVSVKNGLEKLLPAYRLTLVEAPANRPSDVADAARAIVDKVDLFYTSLDNGVVSAMEALAQVANENKIPLIASDEFSVRRGATAALGVNDYDFGVVTSQMVGRVLDGEAPNAIPPQSMNTLTLFFSPSHGAKQGVALDLQALGDGVNTDTTPSRR